MTVCNAAPDRHCCVIGGQVCGFLTADTRCSLHSEWGRLWENPVWRDAPVGRYFAERWPTDRFDCGDWPQNIPGVMAAGVGLCCWQGVSVG